MSANATTIANYSHDSAGELAVSTSLLTATEPPRDFLLDSQYEEAGQRQDVRRLPSPAQLWSDSEEVSDLVPCDSSAFTLLIRSR